MKLSPYASRGWRRVIRITAISAGAGVLYQAAMLGSLWSGALTGGLDGAALSALEIYVLRRRTVVRWPFVAYFALRVALYGAVVLAINGTPQTPDPTRDWLAIGFAIVVCVAFNLVFSVNQLLGPGVLFAFAAGRYRRPRREIRIVLYADLVGSTALAEQLGEERFLDLLNEVFDDLATAIVGEGGEIHKYVGDEVIATWPDESDPAQPIRACFEARRRIAARATVYRAAFGEIPAFRASVHAGPVVLGELGATKKEIALIGDAMNVAARLLEAARDAGVFALVSAAVYDRLAAPLPGYVADKLAPLHARGKLAPMEIVSLREA